MNNAIITTRDDMDVMMWKATTLYQSGLLPQHIKNANQVIAIDMMARELNIPTWQAINGINVIQGKPTVSPQLMLALIERSGALEDIKIDGDSVRCEVMMKRRGRSPHIESFGMMEATAMNLASKDNYKKQPAVMLKWRAIAACARVVFPDVLMGMYTTEEIAPDAVQVSSEGDYEIVETSPERPPLQIAEKTDSPDGTPAQASGNGGSSRPTPAPQSTPTGQPIPQNPQTTPNGNGHSEQPAQPKAKASAGQLMADEPTEFVLRSNWVQPHETTGKDGKKTIYYEVEGGATTYSRELFRKVGYTEQDLATWPLDTARRITLLAPLDVYYKPVKSNGREFKQIVRIERVEETAF